MRNSTNFITFTLYQCRRWRTKTEEIITNYQATVISLIKEGYDTRTVSWFMCWKNVYFVQMICFFKGWRKMDISILPYVYSIRNYDDWVKCDMMWKLFKALWMVRYGSLVPSTKWGKIVTMIYAVCGIPVYVLYFMNMGKVRNLKSIIQKH